jgi:HSP20 family protein
MARKKSSDVAIKKEEGKSAAKASRNQPLFPFGEMETFLDQYFGRPWFRPFHLDLPAWDELARPLEGRVPNVDVIDREKEMVVRAEIPGVKKEDLEVSLNNNRLTIKGSTRHEETRKEEGDYTRRELSRGSFSRTVTLPADVDGENAKAEFKDGVLEMTLPKQKPSKRRRISVH